LHPTPNNDLPHRRTDAKPVRRLESRVVDLNAAQPLPTQLNRCGSERFQPDDEGRLDGIHVAEAHFERAILFGVLRRMFSTRFFVGVVISHRPRKEIESKSSLSSCGVQQSRPAMIELRP
jgi:hypothetical protein